MYPLNLKDMPTTASSMFSAYASFAAFIMLVKSMADQLMSLIPPQLRSYLYSILLHFYTPHSSDLTLIVDEKCGYMINQVYESAEVYLKTKISPLNERLRVSRTPGQKTLSINIDRDEEIMDTFNDITLKWCYVCTEAEKSGDKEKRKFELTVQKKHKTEVTDSYLPYVLARADALRQEEKVLKLTSENSDNSIDLEHPSTFDTLAIAPEIKKMIIEDLDRFLRRKEFYKKVGKAWKRGYLLYGPPGTGKSSLIAAMANYLQFDIYDVELSSVYSNSDLRSIMLSTSNRSILVIEDIDCTVEAQNREDKRSEQSDTNFTLSGLLNFIDGMWSSCADGRIIVFTTNHKDKLDPALLRPGRMDVHIHMSYCTVSGFRILASNYLDIHESNPHRLCGEIEGLIERIEVTPAEIAEELMKSDDADVALEGLVNFLKRKEVEVASNSTRDEGTKKAEIEATN
ncbi:putative ATPase, AAA-type, core, AAA-type ATPase domain-containing protein [Rosa chinensis]|uniref:Putative ATPase, AAA-type, core, AAA-type ATPase domain-containing protein n=1 Tax=Rosa chinensis TaxID=74649 RepID=A0A2P6RMB2_ROSCH|nr:AAA-ATPase At2g18193 [Rosa chinensis]PRQ47531.1 putative ATPase, AAA-type, core, AAA-type ATPase domain-containing protein [Rosa chinensis]